MNILEIQKLLVLSKIKAKPIENLMETCKYIIGQATKESTETFRFVVKIIRGIHPTVDAYMAQSKLIFSDIIGNTAINMNVDTHTADMKYWEYDEGTKVPFAVKNTVKRKMTDDQYYMIKDAYKSLNVEMSKVLASQMSDKYDKNTWAIPRQVSHSYYNTPDENALNIYIRNKPSLLRNISDRYGEKTKLFNHIYPVKDNIKIEDDLFEIMSEGELVIVDRLGNKVILNTEAVDNSPISPKE